jgi:hypothetical protein
METVTRSTSQVNPTTTESTRKDPLLLLEPKRCPVRLAESCKLSRGLIDPARAKKVHTKYCKECAYLLGLRRKAAYKRKKRREMGWLEYLFVYSFSNNRQLAEIERKKEHRKYMQAYRRWLKHRTEIELSMSDSQLRKYRNEFIKHHLRAAKLERLKANCPGRTLVSKSQLALQSYRQNVNQLSGGLR